MSLNKVRTLEWDDKVLKLIDQRKLPLTKEYFVCETYEKVFYAIKEMVVRGAPAIGVTAAYGVAIAAYQYNGNSKKQFMAFMKKALTVLESSRPTAVNLFWALKRMEKILADFKDEDIRDIREKLVREAQKIQTEDVKTNELIGENGVRAFNEIFNEKKELKILTHCNAGALATAGYGTALGVIRSLARKQKVKHVIVDETRPYLQGARLTAWELHEEKIPYFIITDNMAAYMMGNNEVDAIVVGADRIAANGDTANKIGTFGVSVLAQYFKIPFFVAAPLSTIDTGIQSGKEIPIEQRDGKEIREIMGCKIVPDFMLVKNPSFDVTPGKNITAIITEKMIIKSPFKSNIRALFNKAENVL